MSGHQIDFLIKLKEFSWRQPGKWEAPHEAKRNVGLLRVKVSPLRFLLVFFIPHIPPRFMRGFPLSWLPPGEASQFD